MRTISKFTTAAALALTTAVSVAPPADARVRHHRHHYYGRTAYHYRYCRRSSGATGLVVGGVGGALVGRIDGGVRLRQRQTRFSGHPRIQFQVSKRTQGNS